MCFFVYYVLVYRCIYTRVYVCEWVYAFVVYGVGCMLFSFNLVHNEYIESRSTLPYLQSRQDVEQLLPP